MAVTEEQRFWSRRRTNSSTLAFASAGARAAAALLEAAPLWVLLSRPALPGGLPLTTATYIGMILCVVGVLYAIAAAAQRTSSQTVVKTQRWTARGVWRYSQHPDTLARATVIFGTSVLTLSRVPVTVQDVAPFLAVFSPLAPVFLTRAGLLFDSQLERLQSMPSYAVYRHQTPSCFQALHGLRLTACLVSSLVVSEVLIESSRLHARRSDEC